MMNRSGPRRAWTAARNFTAIAIIAVDQHRETARRHDVADAGTHFAEADEPDVGERVTRADEGVAPDRIGGKARALDETRRERVMRAREQQRLAAPQQFLPRRFCLHGRSYHAGAWSERMNQGRPRGSGILT